MEIYSQLLACKSDVISYSFWRDVACAMISSYCGSILASSFSLVAISASMLCCSAAILAYNVSINITAKYTRGRFAINDNILGNLALTIGFLPNRQHSTPTELCSSTKPLYPPTLVCVPGQANPLAAPRHGVEIPVPSKGSKISVGVRRTGSVLEWQVISYAEWSFVIGELLLLDGAGFHISCSVFFQLLELSIGISQLARINSVLKRPSLSIQCLILIQFVFFLLKFSQLLLNIFK